MQGQMKIFHVGAHNFRELLRELLRRFRFAYPKDPDILKTVRVVNLLSVVNLLRAVIHY